MFEETQVDHYSQSNDETNSAEDDNETVLVESSPVKAPEFHHRDLKIDIMAAKHSMAMGPASAPIYNPRLVQQMNNGIVKQESINMYPFTQHSQSTNDIPKYIPQPGYGSQMNGNNKAPLPYSTSTPDALSPYSNSFDGSRPMSFGSIQTSSNMATSTSYKGFPIGDQSHFQAPLPPSSVPGHQQIGQAQLRPESQRGSGASQGESQSHMNMSFMASGRQQLMVNVGSGYVPFGSLSQELQERYMGVQKQFELQQQQQIQQALLQQIQMNNLAGTNLQPHQGIAMNTGNIPLSAPASQTSFADPASKSYNTGQKKHSKPIKFGPMLEYDPSKDNAAAAAAAEAASAALAKAKARGESRPGVSVLNIPRDTPVYIYKPPKRKGPS
ncbi:hypothetical protein CANTEDRAFT_135056 [Yamadazyma tenuis ATCC 10573]|nr:uncharacterized protein CANTEDRAFT_135056 [Yamadazyma tenuis ATCC 10573]EGV63225.1 hypothetical protein CANTEDRAFT_135056 [Yamadazyma tenuis ATCC 10573]